MLISRSSCEILTTAYGRTRTERELRIKKHKDSGIAQTASVTRGEWETRNTQRC